MKEINTGHYLNDPTADTLLDAFQKVNENFAEIKEKLGIGLRKIKWNDIKDTPKAFGDINHNFMAINDRL